MTAAPVKLELVARVAPAQPIHLRRGVELGCRWHPEHAIHREPLTGFYSERNPPLESREARQLQRALLTPPAPPLTVREAQRWVVALALIAAMLSAPAWWPQG